MFLKYLISFLILSTAYVLAKPEELRSSSSTIDLSPGADRHGSKVSLPTPRGGEISTFNFDLEISPNSVMKLLGVSFRSDTSIEGFSTLEVSAGDGVWIPTRLNAPVNQASDSSIFSDITLTIDRSSGSAMMFKNHFIVARINYVRFNSNIEKGEKSKRIKLSNVDYRSLDVSEGIAFRVIINSKNGHPNQDLEVNRELMKKVFEARLRKTP